MSDSYLFTATAKRDLLSIWQYIADNADEETADKVFSQIEQECASLSRSPGIGHFRRELLDERYRFWVIWSYLIVYRDQTQPLRIVAVLHGKRDLKPIFKRRHL